MKSAHYNFLLAFFTTITISTYLITEIYSFDVWWHIVIGTDILEHFSIPNYDKYTIAGFGRPYFDSHWLFQLLLAPYHKASGMNGVQLYMITIWSFTFFTTYITCMKKVKIYELNIIIFFISCIACSERFLVRPEIFTFFFISLYYWLLNKNISTKKAFVVLLISQAIWTNSHGLFVIGPFMVGCYWLNALWNKIADKNNHELHEKTLLMFAVLAGTLISPSGIMPWKYAYILFHEAGSNAPNIFKDLGELSPTFGSASRSGISFWCYLLLLVGSIIALAASFKNTPRKLANHLILLGMLLASFTGRRNIALYALVAGPFITNNLSNYKLPQINKKIATPLTIGLILPFFLFSTSGKYHYFMSFPARMGIGVTPSYFPHKLPQYLNQINFTGNVYNSNTLGGFYLYHSFPKRLPLTDGRWEIYNHQELDFIRSAPSKPRQFRHLVNKYNIKGLLLQHMSPEAEAILPWLNNYKEWQLVYLDNAVSFWLPARLNPQNKSIIKPEANLPSNHDKLRTEDLLMLGNFYRLTSMDDEYITILYRILDTQWQDEYTSSELGKLLIKKERLNEAENIFRQLLRKHPKNLDALNELSFIAFKRGDIKTAKFFTQKILHYYKNNKLALNNLKIIEQTKKKSIKKHNQAH